jgi:hypothetical protein
VAAVGEQQTAETMVAAVEAAQFLSVRILHLRQAVPLSFRAVQEEQARRSPIRLARRAVIRG